MCLIGMYNFLNSCLGANLTNDFLCKNCNFPLKKVTPPSQ